MTWPRIAVISLNDESLFYKIHASLLANLECQVDIEYIEGVASALRLFLEWPSPSAVLITDEALTQVENAYVLEEVLRYVRRGGTAVVIGHFDSFLKILETRPLFIQAGVHGPYYRTTAVPGQATVGDSLAMNLPPQDSHESQFPRNVPLQDAWYCIDRNSVVESLVYTPTSTQTVEGTPVSLTRIGRGNLGYVGDLNHEEGSDSVILAMCGLFQEDTCNLFQEDDTLPQTQSPCFRKSFDRME